MEWLEAAQHLRFVTLRGCRPDSYAERAVVLELQKKLAGREEVFGVVVSAVALPSVVHPLIPVTIGAEDTGSAVEARDDVGNVLVWMHCDS